MLRKNHFFEERHADYVADLQQAPTRDTARPLWLMSPAPIRLRCATFGRRRTCPGEARLRTVVTRFQFSISFASLASFSVAEPVQTTPYVQRLASGLPASFFASTSEMHVSPGWPGTVT